LLTGLMIPSWISAEPVRLHLSLTGDVTQMAVMWQTEDILAKTTCFYGAKPGVYSQEVSGTNDSYSTGSYSSGSIHTAIMTNLTAGNVYYYICGDSQSSSWSAEHNFTAAPQMRQPVTVLLAGDLGTTPHSQSTIDGMMEEQADLVYHVGDMSYADGDNTVWDTWFDMVEPLSSTLPFMVLPGNHEQYNNFVPFDKLFFMPSVHSKSTEGNFYYSFDYSYIHFISLSSESDYSPKSVQHKWLADDLAAVDRNRTPWIIVGWHRPWYSSSTAHRGEGKKMMESMEDILYMYKVDLCLVGHVHSYERTYPVYKSKNTKDGLIHITIGDGGNREGIPPFEPTQPDWSAERIPQYGYAVFRVYNETHLYFAMHQDDNWVVDDDFWIVKPQHNDMSTL